jgi:MFS family permease
MQPRGAPTRPLIAARAVRGVADGFVSALLAQYLKHRGYSNIEVGAIITGTLLGSAALTLYTGLRWGHHQPRRILLWASLLMFATGMGFLTVTWFWPLLVVAVIGTLNPSAGDVSVFLPVEQSAIADLTDTEMRPKRFAVYNVAGGLGGAAGALASPIPGLAARHFGWDRATTEQWSFVVYLAAAVVAALLYRSMVTTDHPVPARRQPLVASRAIVYRLSGLFSLDAAAGGFVLHALLVLYLHQRFGLGSGGIGLVLSGTILLSAGSQLLAPKVARRIGLVRTMAFTHIPASVFLILAGLAPNAGLAIAMLMLRAPLSSMDVPARQALVMRLVPPEERAAAASVTNVPRSLASALTPALAGLMLQHSSFGWPLIIAGVGKITYDLALLAQPIDRD